MCSLFATGRASKFTVTPSTPSGWASSVPIPMLSLALWVKIHALNILYSLVHFYSIWVWAKKTKEVRINEKLAGPSPIWKVLPGFFHFLEIVTSWLKIQRKNPGSAFK